MDNYNTLLLGIIAGIILYCYFMPTLKENMASLTGTNKGVETIDTNKCSRDCCRHVQWPVPHKDLKESEYVGTNLMCNGGTGGGCVCMKKDDFAYLSERAGNGL